MSRSPSVYLPTSPVGIVIRSPPSQTGVYRQGSNASFRSGTYRCAGSPAATSFNSQRIFRNDGLSRRSPRPPRPTRSLASPSNYSPHYRSPLGTNCSSVSDAESLGALAEKRPDRAILGPDGSVWTTARNRDAGRGVPRVGGPIWFPEPSDRELRQHASVQASSIVKKGKLDARVDGQTPTPEAPSCKSKRAYPIMKAELEEKMAKISEELALERREELLQARQAVWSDNAWKRYEPDTSPVSRERRSIFSSIRSLFRRSRKHRVPSPVISGTWASYERKGVDYGDQSGEYFAVGPWLGPKHYMKKDTDYRSTVSQTLESAAALSPTPIAPSLVESDSNQTSPVVQKFARRPLSKGEMSPTLAHTWLRGRSSPPPPVPPLPSADSPIMRPDWPLPFTTKSEASPMPRPNLTVDTSVLAPANGFRQSPTSQSNSTTSSVHRPALRTELSTEFGTAERGRRASSPPRGHNKLRKRSSTPDDLRQFRRHDSGLSTSSSKSGRSIKDLAKSMFGLSRRASRSSVDSTEAPSDLRRSESSQRGGIFARFGSGKNSVKSASSFSTARSIASSQGPPPSTPASTVGSVRSIDGQSAILQSATSRQRIPRKLVKKRPPSSSRTAF